MVKELYQGREMTNEEVLDMFMSVLRAIAAEERKLQEATEKCRRIEEELQDLHGSRQRVLTTLEERAARGLCDAW